MNVVRLDHLVLTVTNIKETCDFYSQTLGMEVVTFGAGRTALVFGEQKINLCPAGKEWVPVAAKPTVGSGDLCFITESPIVEVIVHLQRLGIEIESGPVQKNGALGAMESIYIRDPNGNLVEISKY